MKKINFAGVINITKNLVTRYSSEILVATGIVGMLTTTVIAVKATPKAMQLIEEAKEEKGEELTKLETVKAAAKVYIAPAITAVTSTACIIGASKINRKRNAALATAYAISEAALNEYKDKVVATIGEKKEREIQDAIAKDDIDRAPVHTKEVFLTDNGNTLCYDVMSGRYFRSSMESLKSAICDLNFQMMDDVWVSLNDFYDTIGLKQTQQGDLLGWSVTDGKIQPRFSSQISEKGEPCLVLKYNIAPSYNYRSR